MALELLNWNSSVEISATSKKGSSYASGNTHVGGEGDDLVFLSRDGGNYAAAYGNISIVGDFLVENFIIGENGIDSLYIESKGSLIDFATSIGSGHVTDIERFDLGKTKSPLALDESSVIAMTDIDNELFLTGAMGNTLDIDEANWTENGSTAYYLHFTGNINAADLYVAVAVDVI